MEPVDRLLSELKAKYHKEEGQTTETPADTGGQPSRSAKSGERLDDLLSEVGRDYRDRDRQQTAQEQERLRQRRQALEQQAQNWLRKLDPLSSEGIWFERFARGYPSVLEAAIAYLETLSPPT